MAGEFYKGWQGQTSIASPDIQPQTAPVTTQPVYVAPTSYSAPTYIINYFTNISSNPEAVAASTGIDPSQLAALLYGKPVPLFVAGKVRIGCRIIEGPSFDKVTGTDGRLWDAVSMIVAAARPVNPWSNRTLREVSFDGTPVWRDGSALISGLTVRFNPGTYTQVPDPMSVLKYGSRAVAYRPLCTLAIEGFSLESYNDKIPFVSLLIDDDAFGDPADGVTNQEALQALAEYAGFEPSEISIEGISGKTNGQILATQMTFMDYLQGMRKLYTNWNILTQKKLRVVQKGPTVIDAVIDRSIVLANGSSPIAFTRSDPMTVPREKNYTFIDPDRDYEPNTVTCRQEREPVLSTASAQQENNSLPVVTSVQEAIAQVYFAGFSDEVAREKGKFLGKGDLLGVDPGDVLLYDLPRRKTHRVTTVTRNMSWTADIASEGFLTCNFSMPEQSSDYSSLAASFVVGGQDSNGGFILTSPDGVRWARRHWDTSCNPPGKLINTGSRIVSATSFNGSEYQETVAVSADGKTFTRVPVFETVRESIGLTHSLSTAVRTLAADNAGYVIALGIWIDFTPPGGVVDNGMALWSSSDSGDTWSTVNNFKDGGATLANYEYKHITDVAYGNGIFVGAGRYGLGAPSGGGVFDKIFYFMSNNGGNSWQITQKGLTYGQNFVCFSGTVFVAAGDDLAIFPDYAPVSVSLDGVNWTTRNIGIASFFIEGMYALNDFIIVSGYVYSEDPVAAVIVTSQDAGLTWVRQEIRGTPFAMQDITHKNGRFVGVGGNSFFISDNGTTWYNWSSINTDYSLTNICPGLE